jgi:tRNA-specific 2-thiouridylase
MSKAVKKQKVLVAMSGGVDSSVVACMLKEQGYEVLGVFMHFWAEESPEADYGEKNKCCSLESFNDARRVAQKFGFPIYTLNLEEKFKKEVVDEFLLSYGRGETPNPCVSCNKFIKFDPLIRKADELGADFIATGHYAKIVEKNGEFELWRPLDNDKDQTYFLYTLNQAKLKRILFPLAGLRKPEVRELAKQYGLEVAEKRESQEICFVPEKGHNDFLKRYLDIRPGQIMDLEGRVLGEHQGLPLYTIGQRKGLEIGGTGPYYAAKFDHERNILYVTNSFDDQVLFKDELQARDISWVGPEPEYPCRCLAVIRYRHKPESVVVTKTGANLHIKFDRPQRAITSGQSVVLYEDEQVLGGGIIV